MWNSSRIVRRGCLVVGAAVLLGAANARADQAEQDKAAEAIQKAGGKVERDDKDAEKAITVVNFATTQVGDDALANLKGLAKLKKLTLNGTKVTDAGLDTIKDLASLEKLYLVDTKVTDAGLEKLKGLTNLQILSLVGTPVTDAGLEHLKGLMNLKTVFVFGTKVSDDGAKKLQEAIPKLKVDK